MIHREEWYTCDRCGETIENLIDDVVNALPEEMQAEIPRDDYLKITCADSDISIVDAVFDGKDTETITIQRKFLKIEETIHLCHKCKKEFEKFMENGGG